jgi:hypothetical protein
MAGFSACGSALAWGARGREFKSRRPDQYIESCCFRDLQPYPSDTFELPLKIVGEIAFIRFF